ncbi:MAG: GntR family transcriptional regulator [Mogibacterium sp.]|nr:GntR family transcriptional regulator [Mogibacterium sp.]
MAATIEKTNAIPLYQQLKNKIKREIRTGLLKAGDRLPSEIQMQKDYGLSRVTVRNAMAELESEGYVIKVQGKGSFVSGSDITRLPIGVTSFTEDVKMQGLQLETKVIKADLEVAKSDLDHEFFNLKEGDKIVVLKRVRVVNGTPVCIEENHLPEQLADIVNEDLTGSLYDILMKKYDMVPVNKGRRSVKISFADQEIADLLELSLGTPVINTEMCVFDVNGEPIHTVQDIVRGDNDRIFKWYV